LLLSSFREIKDFLPGQLGSQHRPSKHPKSSISPD
jgi:hypothetical protein